MMKNSVSSFIEICSIGSHKKYQKKIIGFFSGLSHGDLQILEGGENLDEEIINKLCAVSRQSRVSVLGYLCNYYLWRYDTEKKILELLKSEPQELDRQNAEMAHEKIKKNIELIDRLLQ